MLLKKEKIEMKQYTSDDLQAAFNKTRGYFTEGEPNENLIGLEAAVAATKSVQGLAPELTLSTLVTRNPFQAVTFGVVLGLALAGIYPDTADAADGFTAEDDLEPAIFD